MAHSRKQKKYKPCGHLSYGQTCARCHEADRLITGYTTVKGKEVKPDIAESKRLRKPTHEVNSKYRQCVVSGVYDD